MPRFRCSFCPDRSTRRRPVPVSEWLIWSNQHGMWWAPDERGYTRVIDEAGRYSELVAARIVSGATCDGQLYEQRIHPHTGQLYRRYDEVMVLAPERGESGD